MFLRIGEIMDDDHFNAKYYYHWECFRLKPRFQHIDPETQIMNLDKLNKKDQNTILKKVKDELKNRFGRKNTVSSK